MPELTEEGCQLLYNIFYYGKDEEVRELWSMQDGYGIRGYVPCQGYDWSGIRDSSYAALLAMFQKFEHLLNDSEFQDYVVERKKELELWASKIDFTKVKVVTVGSDGKVRRDK